MKIIPTSDSQTTVNDPRFSSDSTEQGLNEMRSEKIVVIAAASPNMNMLEPMFSFDIESAVAEETNHKLSCKGCNPFHKLW